MRASTRQWVTSLIVDLSGQIKLGEGSTVLRDTVKDLLAKGQKNVCVWQECPRFDTVDAGLTVK